jgi:hypothetical protein
VRPRERGKIGPPPASRRSRLVPTGIAHACPLGGRDHRARGCWRDHRVRPPVFRSRSCEVLRGMSVPCQLGWADLVAG